MYGNIWKKSYQSVCSINFYGSSNSNVLGISGFKAGDLILTIDQVGSVKEARSVSIRFYEEDGLSLRLRLDYSYEKFLSMMLPGESNEMPGFAVIEPDHDLSEIPSLTLCRSCFAYIGLRLAVIGYQQEYANLSLKPAMVSSFFRNEQGVSFIQYDGTIKPGTSGGPLLDFETGGVIGIVTNKEISASRIYRELKNSIDGNIDALKAAEGKLHFQDIDPIQVLLVNQNQIKHLAKEFYRNASGRVGFAIDISHVNEFLGSRLESDYEHTIDPD